MRSKMLIIPLTLFTIVISGCSTLNKLVYRPDINQGNYLTYSEVSQLKEGMTKQQVIYLLGSPMLQDPFGTDTWFYVFRRQHKHDPAKQDTLTLKFSSHGELTSIQSDFPLHDTHVLPAM